MHKLRRKERLSMNHGAIKREDLSKQKKIYEAAVIISEQIALLILCVFQLLFLNRFDY